MAAISIIIPIFNHAHTLECSLLSIKAQSVKPLEVIIVNDGSTDNFNEVIKSILEKMNWLNTKVIQQTNQGASAARNRGLREAKGENVIFWDADTVAKPAMLAELESALKAHPEASYAYCQFKFGWKTMRSQSFNAEDLKRYNYIDTTTLIRRPCCPLWDESLQRFQDWDLWLTLLEQGKIGVFVPKVLYKKIVRGRKNYSSWLPHFMYHLPWQTKGVKAYEEAKKIITKKHRLVD